MLSVGRRRIVAGARWLNLNQWRDREVFKVKTIEKVIKVLFFITALCYLSQVVGLIFLDYMPGKGHLIRDYILLSLICVYFCFGMKLEN